MGIPAILFLTMTAALLTVVIWRNTRKEEQQFDERERQLRANAYRYAFLTMFCFALAYYLAATMAERPLMEDGVSIVLCMTLGLTVCSVYSILNGVFFPPSSRKGKRWWLGLCFGLVALGNLLVAGWAIRDGVILTDGALNWRAANLFYGVAFLLITASLATQSLLDRREKAE